MTLRLSSLPPLLTLGAFCTLPFLLTGCGGSSSSSFNGTSSSSGGTTSTGGTTQAAHYVYTDLGSLSDNGRGGVKPAAISDSGVIVGTLPAAGSSSLHSFRHTGTGPVTAADDLGVFPTANALDRGSYATAVNAAGTVAGYAGIANEAAPNQEQDAFVYDSAVHDLGTLASGGISRTYVRGINSAGIVVGPVVNDQGPALAFRHPGTGPLTASDEMNPGSFPNLRPLAINQSGVVVGVTNSVEGSLNPVFTPQDAFAYDTSLHDLGVPAGTIGSEATAVNDNGVIVGFFSLADGIAHAFRHSGLGVLTVSDDLGVTAGFTSSSAAAVNAAGDTVGSLDGASVSHAFVCLANGKIRDLNDATLVTNFSSSQGFQIATGINSHGQIVGYTVLGGGQYSAWLLTPTP